ncbi:hypothetical protein INR49_020988 [Caranx melampygus]|nr:hypothetical protein INR49_020988 [Caranx melampygus]
MVALPAVITRQVISGASGVCAPGLGSSRGWDVDPGRGRVGRGGLVSVYQRDRPDVADVTGADLTAPERRGIEQTEGAELCGGHSRSSRCRNKVGKVVHPVDTEQSEPPPPPPEFIYKQKKGTLPPTYAPSTTTAAIRPPGSRLWTPQSLHSPAACFQSLHLQCLCSSAFLLHQTRTQTQQQQQQQQHHTPTCAAAAAAVRPHLF